MSDEVAISCALLCLRSGRLLEQLDGPTIRNVNELASAAAALLCEPAPAALTEAFARLGSERTESSFQEVCFASAQGAHALLRAQADVAVVAVSPDPQQLSAVISAARRCSRGTTP